LSTPRLTSKAREDVLEIIAFTLGKWGESQARKYRDALYTCFDLIGKRPTIGRRCDWLSSGLRRVEVGKHVIFYKSSRNAIVIYRILHQRMLPRRRAFED
jgi:toxin ParE1/3/4